MCTNSVQWIWNLTNRNIGIIFKLDKDSFSKENHNFISFMNIYAKFKQYVYNWIQNSIRNTHDQVWLILGIQMYCNIENQLNYINI